mgnify:CR=1 FL=1
MDKVIAGFIFLSPGAGDGVYTQIDMPGMLMKVAGVSNYSAAVEKAKTMVSEGTVMLELCAGFGDEGVALVKKAAGGIPVGVVRFDSHPGLGNQSGDNIFA